MPYDKILIIIEYIWKTYNPVKGNKQYNILGIKAETSQLFA